MSLTYLKGDKRTAIFADLWPWLEHTARLYDLFLQEVSDDEKTFVPLHQHEQACVSLLCSGAALAGYLPIAEYDVPKKGKLDKRRREDGRADLWFRSDKSSYSFEFKRSWFSATSKNLDKSLKDAIKDANRILEYECDVAVAGLISAAWYPESLPTLKQFVDDERVNFAFRIGPDDRLGTYLYFSVVE